MTDSSVWASRKTLTLWPLLSPQTVQCELDARRTQWALSLEQLDQYTDSLEKELIKMASNMRRSRTEILHLSVRLVRVCIQVRVVGCLISVSASGTVWKEGRETEKGRCCKEL